MPNGYHEHGVAIRMAESLLCLDGILESFSLAKGLTLIKNERSVPDRSFRWEDELSYLIQVYPNAPSKNGEQAWTLWICAGVDRRRWFGRRQRWD